MKKIWKAIVKFFEVPERDCKWPDCKCILTDDAMFGDSLPICRGEIIEKKKVPDCPPPSIEYDPDDYCGECGSSVYWEDCWQCGGKGGRDGEDLMAEDPLWYDENDFVTCDVCEGKGGFNMCLNKECK